MNDKIRKTFFPFQEHFGIDIINLSGFVADWFKETLLLTFQNASLWKAISLNGNRMLSTLGTKTFSKCFILKSLTPKWEQGNSCLWEKSDIDLKYVSIFC